MAAAGAPSAPGAPAPALGEFDPFASDSVRALVGEVPAPAPKLAAVKPEVALPPPAFPETGAIETISAQTAAAVAQIVGTLNHVDYFQVLRLSHDAVPAQIKKAFYRESRTYHPDRFFHLTEPEVKSDIGTIYKRITEAYYFLRDDSKRKKYAADIAGPERKTKLRFTETSEAETKQQVKKEQEEQIGTHPKGRQFYATAMKDYDAKRWADAQRNLKMALTYERDNARYKEKLAEVEQKLHEESKARGDAFKIR